MALQDHLSDSWRTILADEFTKPYWASLEEFVAKEREDNPGKIYPSPENVFTALNAMPYEDIKVLLLGQDPYHGPDQAHGLSFSVLPGIKIPPSLRNMYKELATDTGAVIPKHGTLTSWAQQGVLLLNTVLTVRHKEANSHKRQGWEKFTDAIIKKLNERDDAVIFLLWGGAAKKKKKKIAEDRHIIVESAHPSPLSAHNGFFGSKPYTKVNAALTELGKTPIDWSIPENSV
jgi:uracil-DNA glycosylase